jgi:hypothetical protein
MPSLTAILLSLAAVTGFYFAYVLYKGRGDDKSDISSYRPSVYEYERDSTSRSAEPITFDDVDPSTDYVFQDDGENTDTSHAGDVSTEGDVTVANAGDDLTVVPGIGESRAERIKSALPVDTLEDLQASARSGKLSEVEGFGEKRATSVLEYLEDDVE